MSTTPGPASFPKPSAARPPRRGLRIAVIASSLAIAIVGAMVVVTGVILGGYVSGAPTIPPREQLWSVRRSPGMTFLDRDGHVLATRGAKYGQPVKLSQLPAYVPKAFLAAEDRRFYQHGPIDIRAIARAIETDLRHKRSVEGASTVTQQLARTLFLKRDSSLKRKVQEAYLAWRLEQAMSKDEILELYMNRTYFGDGAYGLDAAAETYFGKPASHLTLSEAAILAGLPNAPSRLALTNDMQSAVARSRRILATMRGEGWIGDADMSAALASPPVLATPSHAGEGDEGYVLDQAALEAAQLAGGQTPDLVVKTTVDPALQTLGTATLRDVLLKEGAHRQVSQGALVSLAPDGAILAMVGGLDHDRSSFNRVTQAHRQPGSSFKAFVYGAAVEHGVRPTDIRHDAPITYAGWNPENYGHGYAGAVTLQQALARSLNTVSVRLTLEVGPDTVGDFARRLGVSDIPAHPGPSIALGAYEVTPMEMATGYQVFQTGGGRTQPYLISEIRSTRGDVIWSHTASAPTPVLDPLFATRMVGMLKTVITAGTGTGANIGRPAAGKTGTSQSYRDAWFVGFTPDLLTAVWVGNDNGAPMAKVTGGELPAAIWKRFMTIAEKSYPSRDFPWLVAEPPDSGVGNTTEDTGVYRDEPDSDYGGGSMRDEPPDDSDTGYDDGRVVTAQQSIGDDERTQIDSDSGRGPVVIQGGRYSRGADRDYGDDGAYQEGQAPYRGQQAYRGEQPYRGRYPPQAAPERGWRDQPPDYEPDDEAPPPRYSRAPAPPPDSSADDDSRYRY
ncbi:MAG TPA: PBP1A family penicillin-binding protein [Caulobacteraceae bacterium]|nr:PBP1A family penicillin-binding protein [Caulobacteraceae bacterium]